MARDALASAALAEIPKILTLLDRNRHSPTYGCFDRNYWHYRIIDFPSGMAQEFVYPLALVYALDLPDNPYRGLETVREWIAASIRYAAASAHADGSCDDYFPFEKAGGATAFSLLACLEAHELIGLDDPGVDAFLARRADWLAGHHESGRLTNHQALIALCLERAGSVLDMDRWRDAASQRLEKVLQWQTDEGWFWEYEGCDPGYLTLTISLLARLQDLRPSDRLQAALQKAARFAAHFIHPDGTYGGEYGSRNTLNFFPHGFELAGQSDPRLLEVNDRFLEALTAGRTPCYADDHIIAHHVWNYLLAWRDFAADRPAPTAPAEGRTWFPQAGLLIERRGDMTLFAALNKGGVFKAFAGGKLIAADTQFSISTRDAAPRNATGHLIDDYAPDLGDGEIALSGTLGWAKQKRMRTRDLMILRALMLGFGRFFPNLVRRLLQKLLITGKDAAPYRFERRFIWQGAFWRVEDRLLADDWRRVASVAIGVDQTSIYVVMSRVYQSAQLTGWLDLTDRIGELDAGDALTLSRELRP